MLSISDLKVGRIINWRNQPCEVIFAEHSKLGRGGAILRTKLKNLLTGTIVEQVFKGADKVEEADVTTRPAQYLYHDQDNLVFMENSTYEQISLPQKLLGEKSRYLQDEATVELIYINHQPVDIRLPIKVDLKITYTEPGYKGDTASATLKPATLETGAQIQVPLFIKQGDLIRIDTRNGNYVERVK